MTTSPTTGKIIAAGVTAMILGCIGTGWIESLPSALRVLLVGSTMFFVGGYCWLGATTFHLIDGAVRGFLTSIGVTFVSWLVAFALPGDTSRAVFAGAMAAFCAVGILQRKPPARRDSFYPRHLRLVLALVTAVYFCQSYIGATSRVPALEDQDMETQGTAFGLINHASPVMVTNRGTTYFFAHPLLLHFFIGISALLGGEIADLSYYYVDPRHLASANAAELDAIAQRNEDAFFAAPQLIATRTPNIFLGAFIVFPMGCLAYRLTKSIVAAVGAPLLYATLPEVYVRSAYGGYMAIANLMGLLLAFTYLESTNALGSDGGQERAHNGRLTLLGFLGAWADQKVVLVAIAAMFHRLWRLAKDVLWRYAGFRHRLASFGDAFRVAIAFAVGWGIYGVYGLAISPKDFISDHVVGHVLARVDLSRAMHEGPASMGWYPSALQLWTEFGSHVGWPLAATMGLAVAWSLTRLRRAEGLLVAWVILGSVVFSLTDWRQTKHLAQVLPPLVLLVALFVSELPDAPRRWLTAVLGLTVCWNAWRVVALMTDFSRLQPTPIW